MNIDFVMKLKTALIIQYSSAYCSNHLEPTQEDIFEQIVKFSISEQYIEERSLVEILIEKIESYLII